jgi:bifunctional non-homologous end joining protein LigD
LHELKLDGYRIQAHLRDGRVTLYTRTGLDWTKRFPTIAADVGRLPAGKLVIDGEIISADADGRPNFGALQDDLKRRRYDRMVYYAFDLLHLDGFDTRAAPLIERKRVLQSFLTESAPGVIYSEHFEDGAALYAQAAKLGLEGVVSKRADAPYRSGRGDHWCKVKCWKQDRFVVVGFAPDGAGGLAKLRLARREGGKPVYAGRVGTGWDYRTAREIRTALMPLSRSTSPLAKPIKKKDTTWVEPRYEAEIIPRGPSPNARQMNALSPTRISLRHCGVAQYMYWLLSATYDPIVPLPPHLRGFPCQMKASALGGFCGICRFHRARLTAYGCSS